MATDARIDQLVSESVSQDDTPDARVTQALAEVASQLGQPAFVGQVLAETVSDYPVAAVIDQFLVETVSSVTPQTAATVVGINWVVPGASAALARLFDIHGTGTLTQPAPQPRRYIRRLRQTPHLSAEEANLFYSRFQLDLETGVGILDGQGERPKVMLQWSTDHGHTWSHEHWIECGPMGAYRWRAIWRRLGRARDMVFRIVISDPIPVTLIDAYVDVTKGTS